MNEIIRRVAVSSLVFLALLVVAAWPWLPVQRGFSAIYCPIANLFLAPQIFGQGGHARLVPLSRIERHATDNVTADAALALTVAGFDGDLPMGMSLRRDVYLPLWILIALLVAVPLRFARRMKALAIGISIMVVLDLAALELTVAWTFAFQLRGIYADAGSVWRRLVDLAYGALLTPPGNRFIAPLAIGAVIFAWLREPQARRDSSRRFDEVVTVNDVSSVRSESSPADPSGRVGSAT